MGKRKTTLYCLSLLLFLFIVVFTACKKTNTKNNNSSAEGYRTFKQGGAEREYILHVPSSYDMNTAVPLLINFHGFGGTASDFVTQVGEGSQGLNALADQENFLIAYPQGVERSKGDAEWDPGDNMNQNINDNDLYFVEQLIADIKSDYNIDLSRVYASGYSNGGMMAYGLACKRSHLIAAVGVMSGIMLPDGTCSPTDYTSVIHFHGAGDDVLPLNGNQDFQSVAATINFWLTHNGIQATSMTTTQLNGGDVVRDEYTGGNGNTSVVLYTINKEYNKAGGHVWFSGAINGQHPNQILWGFLSQYNLND